MEKSIKHLGSIMCPHCKKPFTVGYIENPNLPRQIHNEACETLRREWIQAERCQYSDNQSLNWLSGRENLLRDAGLNKYSALKEMQRLDKTLAESDVDKARYEALAAKRTG